MKDTLVVNIFGAPGVGKSTTMASVFAILKQLGVDCEMVSEFAKDLVWEKREETFKDELYIFAKQAHRLFRVNGKVDVIVTDRPLFLTALYNEISDNKSKSLTSLVVETFNQYNNVNFFLTRNKDVAFQENGRNQNAEESDKLSDMLEELLQTYNIEYIKSTTDESIDNKIAKYIFRKLCSEKH